MQSDRYSGQATKAEIGFEIFPSDTHTVEANRLVQSLDGVIQILADRSVRRMAVLFDPTIADLSLILSTLEPFCLNPKVISVTTPVRVLGNEKDRNGQRGKGSAILNSGQETSPLG